MSVLAYDRNEAFHAVNVSRNVVLPLLSIDPYGRLCTSANNCNLLQALSVICCHIRFVDERSVHSLTLSFQFLFSHLFPLFMPGQQQL